MAFIEAENVYKLYPAKRSLIGKPKTFIHAVDGVSLTIDKGSVVGLVGESGSGKSTLGRLLVAMEKPTKGSITVDGVDLAKLKGRKLSEARKKLQIVFQNPDASLNPRMKIGEILSEALRVAGEEPSRDRVDELLASVGLQPGVAEQYPHQLSGGMKQRVAIARALAAKPEFVVLDEPTSALDVSVQAQILNLLLDLQEKYNLTYLFISHNLAVVHYISDITAVMYLGEIVEQGPAHTLYKNPWHPYTKALISSMPLLYRVKAGITTEKVELKGEPPSPINPPKGCKLHPRCPYATEKCRREKPPEIRIGKNHTVKCWLYAKK